MEVSFSLSEDEDSPAETVVYINAYDSNYSPLSVDFSTSSTGIVRMLLNKLYDLPRKLLSHSPLLASSSYVAFQL